MDSELNNEMSSY